MNTSQNHWEAPTHRPGLSPDVVHIWRADVGAPAVSVANLERTLADDEVERANRLYSTELRERFVVCRGAVRQILGLHLDVDPALLQFERRPHGKPCLAVSRHGGRIEFNVSHSGELLLVAVACGRPVGIDVEKKRPVADFDKISRRFFSPLEHATMEALPAHQREEAFFKCWTSKESYLKATGDGLSKPLDQFDVAVVPGELAALLSHRGDSSECSRWSMVELRPAEGYAGALTVEGTGWTARQWQWRGSETYGSSPR
jgi:4'-phosphopantetheinyl transferase